MPPPDIVAHFKAVYDLDISYQLIYHYRRSETWSEFISEERLAYDAEVSECFLACKRNRMDSLYTTYLLAKEKQDPKGMVMAVAQAQKEMEGTKLALVNKEGEDFSFNINIGPPPEDQKPRQVGPVLTLISPSKDDDEVD
jgi:hypothetical protein